MTFVLEIKPVINLLAALAITVLIKFSKHFVRLRIEGRISYCKLHSEYKRIIHRSESTRLNSSHKTVSRMPSSA